MYQSVFIFQFKVLLCIWPHIQANLGCVVGAELHFLRTLNLSQLFNYSTYSSVILLYAVHSTCLAVVAILTTS